ncbi:MAG TPA: radical SAM protein [Patescibacteria group bacterium]|nr:radical SAM protein [Patescibacteria group bacterium]
MKLKEIKVKSVLTKSGLPDSDWVINPYVGCSFGCKYCYATFIGRWKHPNEEWGEFLDVKINAPEVLKDELEKLASKYKSKDFGSIFFSSVTDPYNGFEAKYQVTRKCLEVLTNFGYKGKIGILTKSPLLTRDIDFFRKLNLEAGLTITTLDDEVVKFLEGNAPPASARINALKTLNEAGVSAYAFVGPLLPYFIADKATLEKLFVKIKDAGVNKLYVEHINLSPRIKSRLYRYLRKTNPKLVPVFEQAKSKDYQIKVENIIHPMLDRNHLKLIDGKILFHNNNKN